MAQAKKTAAKTSTSAATAPRKASARKAPAKKSTATKKASSAKVAKKAPAPKPSAKGSAAKPSRTYDLTVFGATGFTGRLVAKYLAGHAPADMRIALAGRDRGRVEQIRDEIGGRAHDFGIVTANVKDDASLAAMAADTTALITTVGPYASYGLPVVAACAEAGTHYCDLTGEVLFMRDSIDRYDDIARASGARIVHSCGFDSIPSDLGVLALQLAATADDPKAELGDTRLVVTGAKGGVSGGTIASGLGELERAGSDATAARVLADPYSLSPDRGAEPTPGDAADPKGPVHDDVVGAWLAPFLMGPINSRVVRRSNALGDYSYGRGFRYQEYVATGDGPLGRLSAFGLSAGMATAAAALGLDPVRSLAAKILPDPGEGPGEEARAQGRFSIVLNTRTKQGVPYRAKVAAQGDPGYAATAMMLATTGMTLATGTDLPDVAGVLTPATGIGEPLITALKRAGMTLEAARV